VRFAETSPAEGDDVPDEIPKDVLGKKPKTPEEYAKQQERIEKWLVKRAAERAAKKFEEGQ
jgi:hypothetical protein